MVRETEVGTGLWSQVRNREMCTLPGKDGGGAIHKGVSGYAFREM